MPCDQASEKSCLIYQPLLPYPNSLYFALFRNLQLLITIRIRFQWLTPATAAVQRAAVPADYRLLTMRGRCGIRSGAVPARCGLFSESNIEYKKGIANTGTKLFRPSSVQQSSQVCSLLTGGGVQHCIRDLPGL
jgi:hypothetical protein